MGGITTSVISLPLAIAFGVVAFAPLGEEYIAQGALTGLYGVIVAGILTSLFGGTPGLIAVPTAPMSVMVTSIIATLLKDPDIAALGDNQVMVILLLVSMTLLIAGMLQLIMGAVGGGKLIKFIPYPVIAGFMNGIAIIIFLAQLRPFFGVGKEASLLQLFTGGAGVRYETVLVGTVTILTMIASQRLTKAIPGSLVGLLCGVGAYFAIGEIISPSLLHVKGNPLVIGAIPSALPTPKQVTSFLAHGTLVPLSRLGTLIIPAVTLSVLASIDTLLTSVVTDMVTKGKHNSTKELFGQGVGNIASACFGGLPVAGSTLATMVNVNAGSRTGLGGLVNSIMVLLVVMFLGGLVQWIPMSVLAGILLVTSVGMIEYESINLTFKKSALGNLFVIVAVTVITVAVDLIVAVLVGLIITAFLFIREQISKNIVRKTYTGNLIHSKKIRSQEAMNILLQKGDRIKIYELSGSLFFGTCDKLLTQIEQEIDNFAIILDFKRVHTIDLTGAQLLKQIIERVQEAGTYFIFSHLQNADNPEKRQMFQFLQENGVVAAIGKNSLFPDIDRAQEWVEDKLIETSLAATEDVQKLALHNLEVFQDLDDEQLEIVRQHLYPVEFKAGDIVFREGDPGDKIYFLMCGSVSVLASLSANGDASSRLATFGEGVFFGDMAILEKKPRSATVRADAHTEVLYMTVDDFEKLVKTRPLIASKMLLGMTRELSYRLRLTTIEVRTLEQD